MTTDSEVRAYLEALYRRYHRAAFISPDPIQLVRPFADPADREIAGLLVSSLAYGRVAMILRNAGEALDRLGPRPALRLRRIRRTDLQRRFDGFRHRFTDGGDVASLLWGAARVIRTHGSLNACFTAGLRPEDETVIPAATAFVEELHRLAGTAPGYLLPSPKAGSACKRLLLYLRWMAAHDAVYPGGWQGVPTAKLVIPLDTHMFRIAASLGFTRRKTAGLRAALETTRGFARLRPDDPTRYDFCLTRAGIRAELDAVAQLAALARLSGQL